MCEPTMKTPTMNQLFRSWLNQLWKPQMMVSKRKTRHGCIGQQQSALSTDICNAPNEGPEMNRTQMI